jgi:hypothetical protein
MDLGRKMKSPGAIPASPVDSGEPKITYPGLSLSDKVAEEFAKEHEPKLGDEFAATVRLRVTSLTADEYGQRVSFDVLELDDVTEEGEETDEDRKKASESSDSGSGSGESEDDASETKVLGYKRKKTEKETPDLSAKSLQD